MSDRVVIDGDVSLASTIDGEGNAFIRFGQNPIIEPLEVTENGTYEVPDGVDGFNPVAVGIPEYDGAYTVEPSAETQTLATAGKVMTQDVTVGQVEPVLWKTMTLDESWYDVGLTKLMSFLGIEEGGVRDGYTYIVFANGNADTSLFALRVEIISIFSGYPDEVRGLTIRRDYNNLMFGNAANVGRAMSAGTVVKIYRFKR